MNTTKKRYNLQLRPVDNERLANLCGECDQHLRQIEQHLEVTIFNRSHAFQIQGSRESVKNAQDVLNHLYLQTLKPTALTPDLVHLYLNEAQAMKQKNASISLSPLVIGTTNGFIKPHTPTQYAYLENILNHDINFGVGPAGTGKTYLAVAAAVSALEQEKVSRIILVRPAVEAGEKLGFLPGDFSQKLDPYCRPLYDALYAMLGSERVVALLDAHIIEIAPLAYMRGRTLNDAFIILDEAQNTTKEQMKMFLTRIGYNSKAVINGDITQIDLPKGVTSGLVQSIEILKNIKGISATYFQHYDVVRHPLIKAILNAYEEHGL